MRRTSLLAPSKISDHVSYGPALPRVFRKAGPTMNVSGSHSYKDAMSRPRRGDDHSTLLRVNWSHLFQPCLFGTCYSLLSPANWALSLLLSLRGAQSVACSISIRHASRLAGAFRVQALSYISVSAKSPKLLWPAPRLNSHYHLANPNFATDTYHWFGSSSQVPACVLEVGSAQDASSAVSPSHAWIGAKS